jgi:hypothetical protein
LSCGSIGAAKSSVAKHRLLPLAHRKAADRVAVEADGDQRLGALAAQAFVERALLDAEQRRLPRVVLAGVERRPAAPRPAHRQRHRGGDLVARAVGGGALVEGHDDVAAEQALDLHRALGAEQVARAVEVAGERHALLGDLAQLAEAHHLVAAAVGEDRAVPVHEAVQPAEPRDALGAGAEHQVVGVAEDHVGPAGADVLRLHRLDGGGGADRHERRRADLAAAHADRAGAGGAVAGRRW